MIAMVNRTLRCSLFSLAVCLTGCVPITPPTPQPAVRYIAFGDSTTDGPADRNYSDILRELLGESVESFSNQGQSGETSAEGLQRLSDPLNVTTFPNVEFFLYWEGGNDVANFIGANDPLLFLSPDDPDYPFTTSLTSMLDAMEDNIEQVIRSAKDANLDVYVATYYPLAPNITSCGALAFDLLFPSQAEKAQVYLDLMNERIRNVASTNGATLVDVFTLGMTLQADPNNYHDCNHLTEQGNAIVAELFFTEISGK